MKSLVEAVLLRRADEQCDLVTCKFHGGGREVRTFRAPPKPRGVCSVPGCGKPHHARGYCANHYHHPPSVPTPTSKE